ncbi:high mobility group nucleosome-binding domain-containing protein 4 isoform X1 [Balaenoptera musculus]|uniref:High mobility group nucleosome-binding domain-containing protein 4 isoform X1 n=1 Tax=Balaenoptera musculus TaxID=9771 RepID=A0A8B8YUJ4_BALMU|nr:high mobility group nucleosome-binding domain-containing protein 4 isoform X1 [Balaenoptera musculus]
MAVKRRCPRWVRSPRPRRRTHASRGGEPGCPRLCKAARRPQPRKRILALPSCSRQRPAPGVSSLAHCPRRPCPSREHLRGRPAAGSLAPLTRRETRKSF